MQCAYPFQSVNLFLFSDTIWPVLLKLLLRQGIPVVSSWVKWSSSRARSPWNRFCRAIYRSLECPFSGHGYKSPSFDVCSIWLYCQPHIFIFTDSWLPHLVSRFSGNSPLCLRFGRSQHMITPDQIYKIFSIDFLNFFLTWVKDIHQRDDKGIKISASEN